MQNSIARIQLNNSNDWIGKPVNDYLLLIDLMFIECRVPAFSVSEIILLTEISIQYNREFHNKVPPDKIPLLCRKFCVINKPFTENIVYFCF